MSLESQLLKKTDDINCYTHNWIDQLIDLSKVAEEYMKSQPDEYELNDETLSLISQTHDLVEELQTEFSSLKSDFGIDYHGSTEQCLLIKSAIFNATQHFIE